MEDNSGVYCAAEVNTETLSGTSFYYVVWVILPCIVVVVFGLLLSNFTSISIFAVFSSEETLLSPEDGNVCHVTGISQRYYCFSIIFYCFIIGY